MSDYAVSENTKEKQKNLKWKPMGLPCPRCREPLLWESSKKMQDWAVYLLCRLIPTPRCKKCGSIKVREMPASFRIKFYFRVFLVCLLVFVIGFAFACWKKHRG